VLPFPEYSKIVEDAKCVKSAALEAPHAQRSVDLDDMLRVLSGALE